MPLTLTSKVLVASSSEPACFFSLQKQMSVLAVVFSDGLWLTDELLYYDLHLLVYLSIFLPPWHLLMWQGSCLLHGIMLCERLALGAHRLWQVFKLMLRQITDCFCVLFSCFYHKHHLLFLLTTTVLTVELFFFFCMFGTWKCSFSIVAYLKWLPVGTAEGQGEVFIQTKPCEGVMCGSMVCCASQLPPQLIPSLTAPPKCEWNSG